MWSRRSMPTARGTRILESRGQGIVRPHPHARIAQCTRGTTRSREGMTHGPSFPKKKKKGTLVLMPLEEHTSQCQVCLTPATTGLSPKIMLKQFPLHPSPRGFLASLFSQSAPTSTRTILTTRFLTTMSIYHGCDEWVGS